MRIYLDTSVLVAFYFPESISDQIEKIMLQTDRPAISQLTEIELSSAIAKKIRGKCLTVEKGREIISLFQTHIQQKGYTQLPLQPGHYTAANNWIYQFNSPLRTLDALHLAIASKSNLTLLTADRKLVESAKILGVDAALVSSRG